jgi:polysaccharide deacetylase 2 family uncharacterized protein YibQ
MADATPDDLTKPLPRRSKAPRPARLSWLSRISLARLVMGTLGVLALALTGYVAIVDDPLGGEPHMVSQIVERPVAPSAPATPPASAAPPVQPPRGPATASQLEEEAGVSVVRGGGEGAPGSVVIRLPEPVSTTLAPAPDRRLVERSRHGLLPRVGQDGARPSEVYARRSSATLPSGSRPVGRIALVVTGLGISQVATGDAISRLPGPISFAFAPYGGDLERHVARAREDGHEVLLQVPMEPFDYPDNDPGPHTLMADGKGADNLEKLHWVMGRFTGYVGIVNFMGARFTSDAGALAPVLRDLGERGLFALDDGSSPRSQLLAGAQSQKIPALRADVVLDAVARPDAIDKELARLEALARERGQAIGIATALPLSVERLGRWTKSLEERGLLLVPVTALVPKRGA